MGDKSRPYKPAHLAPKGPVVRKGIGRYVREVSGENGEELIDLLYRAVTGDWELTTRVWSAADQQWKEVPVQKSYSEWTRMLELLLAYGHGRPTQQIDLSLEAGRHNARRILEGVPTKDLQQVKALLLGRTHAQAIVPPHPGAKVVDAEVVERLTAKDLFEATWGAVAPEGEEEDA